MATLADMQSNVSKRLLDTLNTAVSSADVVSALNDAMAYWKLRKFYFNERRGAVSFPYQSYIPTLPSDFLVPSFDDGAFEIEYSQQRYPLQKVTNTIYNEDWMGNGYGRPWQYARLGTGGYAVYPIPDQNYVGWCYYLADYPDLVNNTDTNDWTLDRNARRVLELWATGNLLSELRQDQTQAQSFWNSAQNQYQQTVLLASKANGSGTATLHSCLV